MASLISLEAWFKLIYIYMYITDDNSSASTSFLFNAYYYQVPVLRILTFFQVSCKKLFQFNLTLPRWHTGQWRHWLQSGSSVKCRESSTCEQIPPQCLLVDVKTNNWFIYCQSIHQPWALVRCVGMPPATSQPGPLFGPSTRVSSRCIPLPEFFSVFSNAGYF